MAELQNFLTQHTIEYDTVPKEVAAKAEDKPADAELGKRFYCVIVNSTHVCLQLLWMKPLFPLLLLNLLMEPLLLLTMM